MKEDEFRALLAIQGADLRVTYTEPDNPHAREYRFLAIAVDKNTMQPIRYAVGKSYNQAVKAIIKAYYADT